MNKVLVGDCFKVLPELSPDSIDLCVTSPPYWGLRSYGSDCVQIFGGDPSCEHEWTDIKDDAEGYSSKTRWQHGENGRGEKALLRRDDPEAWMKGVREYSWCGKCGAWKGQLGLEPHPQMFIDHLVEFGRLIRRVLKPSGLFWLNLGDSYFGGHGNLNSDFNKRWGNAEGQKKQEQTRPNIIPPRSNWLQPKQLLMIPSRVACALQDDGWILRSDVIWSKPNHMPESVTDRFTKSYEHFFMFSKEQRYYFNLDAIREKYAPQSITRLSQPSIMSQMGGEKQEILHGGDPGNGNRPADILKGLARKYNGKYQDVPDPEVLGSPRARNSRVLKSWGATEDGEYNGKSIKSYDGIQEPKEVKKRIIEGLLNNPDRGKNPGDVWEIPTQPFPGSHFAVFPENLVKRIIKCSSPPKGVVLDPFAGSGTTLRVARKLGRQFIGIELNPEYAKMAEERIRGRNFRMDLGGSEQIDKM